VIGLEELASPDKIRLGRVTSIGSHSIANNSKVGTCTSLDLDKLLLPVASCGFAGLRHGVETIFTGLTDPCLNVRHALVRIPYHLESNVIINISSLNRIVAAAMPLEYIGWQFDLTLLSNQFHLLYNRRAQQICRYTQFLKLILDLPSRTRNRGRYQ